MIYLFNTVIFQFPTLENKRVTDPSVTSTSNLFDAMAISAGPAGPAGHASSWYLIRVMCVYICVYMIYMIMYCYQTKHIYIYILYMQYIHTHWNSIDSIYHLVI